MVEGRGPGSPTSAGREGGTSQTCPRRQPRCLRMAQEKRGEHQQRAQGRTDALWSIRTGLTGEVDVDVLARLCEHRGDGVRLRLLCQELDVCLAKVDEGHVGGDHQRRDCHHRPVALELELLADNDRKRALCSKRRERVGEGVPSHGQCWQSTLATQERSKEELDAPSSTATGDFPPSVSTDFSLEIKRAEGNAQSVRLMLKRFLYDEATYVTASVNTGSALICAHSWVPNGGFRPRRRSIRCGSEPRSFRTGTQGLSAEPSRARTFRSGAR